MLKNNIFPLLMFLIIYPVIHLIFFRWLGFETSKYLYMYYMFALPLLLILLPIINSLLNPSDKTRKIINWLSLTFFISWVSFMFYLMVTGEFV